MISISSDHPFDLLVQRGDRHIRLAEAALLFAIDHYPRLKIRPWLERLDSLARRVDRFNARTLDDQIEVMRLVLVDQERFTGNRRDYHNPRNSLLNEVMDRRMGIPITLSTIWLDVAHQLNWPVFGVGLPGHFLIKWSTSYDEMFVDPFSRGKTLDRDDCEQIVSDLSGRPVALEEERFEPLGVKATLTRMLSNLSNALGQREEWGGLGRVLSRLMALHPESTELRRQLDLVLANIGRLN